MYLSDFSLQSQFYPSIFGTCDMLDFLHSYNLIVFVQPFQYRNLEGPWVEYLLFMHTKTCAYALPCGSVAWVSESVESSSNDETLRQLSEIIWAPTGRTGQGRNLQDIVQIPFWWKLSFQKSTSKPERPYHIVSTNAHLIISSKRRRYLSRCMLQPDHPGRPSSKSCGYCSSINH